MCEKQKIGYSYQGLDEALGQILGAEQVEAMIKCRTGRPKMCEMAASSIVREQLDWNRQCVRIISLALHDLHIEGQFNFNEEKAYPS